MKVSRLNKDQGTTLNLDSLLSYLSQIVLIETDEEISIKQKDIDAKKIELGTKKENLRVVKNRLVGIMSEENRLKSLLKVLKTIRTLKKEGLLVGNNRVRISKIIDTVRDQDEKTLETLLNRLSIYLPDGNRLNIL